MVVRESIAIHNSRRTVRCVADSETIEMIIVLELGLTPRGFLDIDSRERGALGKLTGVDQSDFQ